MKKNNFDYVILGAGIYGLHAAKILSSRGLKIAVVEFDSTPFMRATFVNQARVHNGYHYPRSFSTAIKSSQYFEKFNKEFGFAINNKFEKIYVISSMFSLTNAKQYKDFCDTVNIPCEEINSNKYFKSGMVEAAFLTEEYAFDANMIRDYMYKPLSVDKNVTFFFNMKLDTVDKDDVNYYLNFTENNIRISTPNVLNATYAATNQIINKFKFDEFSIKYEICEMILTDVSDNLKNGTQFSLTSIFVVEK